MGVDLGTTYTAAATWTDGASGPEVLELGDRSSVMPTVVFARPDGSILLGEAAENRSIDEPSFIAREFKRRLGDSVPVLVGGSPWSAEALLAEVLHHVVAVAATRFGSLPTAIGLSHPANWGSYRLEQFGSIPRLADVVDVPVTLLSEPVAAALHYSSSERILAGSILAVYDLGGGTFDATVVRVEHDGASVLGNPEGIERLGGIDFDAAVFDHVRSNCAELFSELDDDDPLVAAALGQMREACRRAKEALSGDTDASVIVALPTGMARVRLNRDEFEARIRPQLQQSVGAMRRALRSADLDAEQLDRVLLVGGSSRIPLVGQMLAGALGRPIAVDASPKDSVALGAALAARNAAASPTINAPAAAAAEPAPPDAPPEVTSPTSKLDAKLSPAAKRANYEPLADPVAKASSVNVKPVEPISDPSPKAPVATTSKPQEKAPVATTSKPQEVATPTARTPGPVAATPSNIGAPGRSGLTPITVAGQVIAGFEGDGGHGTRALLNSPSDVAFAGGNLLIADTGNHCIRQLDRSGSISTICGDGVAGFVGDGGPAAFARLSSPTGLSVAAGGEIYIADSGNHCVRCIDTSGAIITVAGNGSEGYSGDLGPASSAQLSFPRSVAVGNNGSMYIADTYNNRIRKVGVDGVITTISGSVQETTDGEGYVTGGLNLPQAIAIDSWDSLLCADSNSNRIIRVLLSGQSSLVFGWRRARLQLRSPRGLTVTQGGLLLVADSFHNRLVLIDSTAGSARVIAGNGSAGYSGDGDDATKAQFNSPRGVAVDADGSIVVADSLNHVVRRLVS